MCRSLSRFWNVHSHYTYRLAAIFEICKLEGQNDVKNDCPISEIKKGISEVICAKFHDFFTKCTRGSIFKTYSIDYQIKQDKPREDKAEQDKNWRKRQWNIKQAKTGEEGEIEKYRLKKTIWMILVWMINNWHSQPDRHMTSQQTSHLPAIIQDTRDLYWPLHDQSSWYSAAIHIEPKAGVGPVQIR